MIFEEQVKIYNVIRRKKHSKHLTVFFPETVNIKKVAIITANTKKCGQITLNTKPHSYPRLSVNLRMLNLSFIRPGFVNDGENFRMVRTSIN